MAEAAGIQKVRAAFEAFGRGDLESVRDGLADDIVWHHPGNNVLSGDYKGPDEVIGFFGRVFQETNGTFKTDVHDVVGNDEHVVVLMNLRGERNGKQMDVKAANIFHVNSEGRATERWLLVEDTQAFDDFWS